jgi:hypothetical protein
VFELVNSIEVDRKNSLPVADLHARYRRTGTPVVFGDLTQHWPATKKWSADYLSSSVGDVKVPVFSNVAKINGGRPSKPVLHSRLEVYIEELLHQENDLRISKLPLNLLPELERDFVYPRLGFDFNKNLTSLSVGAQGAFEPMRQSSGVVHSVRCNFGERSSVLLIPPEQSPLMYRVGNSQYSVRDINFDQPQFDKYPALRYLSGYVAELDHGDALYIPAGFWYCVGYHGVGINLSFDSLLGGLPHYASAVGKSLIRGLRGSIPFKSERLERLEASTISKTNARLRKFKG